jgi:hypothetical protein
MTQREYERLYAEALELLRTRIAYEGPEIYGGTRLLFVDGSPCDDEAVFEMAWGAETAQEIMSKKSLSRR